MESHFISEDNKVVLVMDAFVTCSVKSSHQQCSSSDITSVAGVDVTANQEEIENTETFQLEAEAGSGRWYIRTMQDRYFTLQPGGGVQAADKVRTQQALFDLEWQEDGSVCIKGSNGNHQSLTIL